MLLHFLVTSVVEPTFPETVCKWNPDGFDVIFLGSILHLFGEPQVKIILDNCRKILKPNGILYGRTLGSTIAGQKNYEIKGM